MKARVLTISSSADADQADLAQVHNGLLSFNEAQAGEAGFRNVYLLARDDTGAIRAGLVGKHIWGCLQVDTLWVEESFRGQGLGSRLLVRAESEAVAAGCNSALLDTFDFQAPAFYESHGYACFAVLDDFPRGHKRYYLRKCLGS